MPVLRSAIVREPIDIAALVDTARSDSCGAISIFLGMVRDRNDGRTVSGIDYEAYESMAGEELARVATEVCSDVPDLRLVLEHRIGTLGIGDISVAIVAAHPHRAEACDAAREVIEELKRRVPIWKREHYTDGSREWVDPTRVSGSDHGGDD